MKIKMNSHRRMMVPPSVGTRGAMVGRRRQRWTESAAREAVMTTTESARWKRTMEDFSALARDCERTLDRRDGAGTSTTSASSDGSLVKLTVEARRLLSGLKTKAKAAEDALEAQKSELLTTEYERRKDTLDSLEMRIATIVKRLSVRTKDERKSDEDGALETRGTRAESSGSFPSPDPESILQLQQEMLEEQDDALEDLSSAAERAKQVSMAVNEELDLHTKLLDDLEGDVDDTRGRLTLATRAVKRMMRRGSNCRAAMIATLVMVICMLLLLLIIKLQR